MAEEILTQAPLAADEVEIKRRKLFNRNKWFFSVGGIGRDMAYALIASFLLNYIQFGVSLTVAQFSVITLLVGVIGPIWDGINDPIMGAIIEGTHMKWGKFKPWILIGAVSCAAMIMLMFNIRPDGWGFVVFMIVMYLLWESTFTMNDIGYWAMLPSLSSVNKERNSATMFTVLFAGIGAIIAQGVIPSVVTGNMVKGYGIVAIVVGISFIGFQLLTSLGVKEPPRQKADSKPVSMKKMWATIKGNDQLLWMTLSMVFYSVGSSLITALAANLLYSELSYDGSLYSLVVVVYGLVSVFVSVVYPWLATKLGRKKLQFWSIMLAVFGYVFIALMGWAPAIFPSNVYLFAVFIVFISIGQSLFYMSSIVNMTNCVEYNDYKQGERNEAIVSTLRPFMAKVSAALHMLVVLIVLTVSGIYGISNNISAMETQKSMFETKLETLEEQKEYIEEVQYLMGELEGLEGDAFTAKVKELMEAVEGGEDFILKGLQLDITYAPVIGDTVIVVKLFDTVTGIEDTAGAIIFQKRLKELTSAEIDAGLASVPSGKVYKLLTMEVGEVAGFDGHSAANLNFKEKVDLGGRIWLRLATTALPIALLLIALFIQRKKFIIDEPYYDMMLDEIAKRDAAKENAQEETQEETQATE